MFNKEELERRLLICIEEKTKSIAYTAKLRVKIHRYRKALKAIEEVEKMK